VPTLQIQDVEQKKKLRAELAQGKHRDLLTKIDATLKANGADPYCTGNQMNVCDLKLAHQFHMIASGFLEHFPENYLDQFPAVFKLYKAVYNHPKVKEYYAPKIATAIWFTAKEGELEKLTQVYVDNPFKAITGHVEASLYTIGQEGSVQGTAMIWNSEKDRLKALEYEDVKKGIGAVKDSGLLAGPPTSRNFEVVAEISSPGKSVKAHCTCMGMFRLKAKEGKLDDLAQTYTKHALPHVRQYPEHLIKLVVGIARNENEFVGVAFYVSKEAIGTVTTNDSWSKVVAACDPFVAETHRNICTLKHAWHH